MKNKTGSTNKGMILTILIFLSLLIPQKANSPEEWVSFPLYPMKVEAKESEISSDQEKPIPLKISIPSVSIDLPIKPASFSANNWEFFDDAASYWKESAQPGEKGNLVIYAHRDKHFAPLKEARIGEQILIDTSKGRRSYSISDFKVVSPGQIEVFNPSDEEILTLLTCTNENDSDRLVITAKPTTSFADLLS
jgi:LPXTG-site transpeptidase (sortase) family protein